MKKFNSSQFNRAATAKRRPRQAKDGQGWRELQRRLLQHNPQPEDREACEWFLDLLQKALSQARQALGERLQLIAAVGALAQGRVNVQRLEEKDLELLVLIHDGHDSLYAINDTLSRAAFGEVLTEFGLLLLTRVYSVTEWRRLRPIQPVEVLTLVGQEVS